MAQRVLHLGLGVTSEELSALFRRHVEVDESVHRPDECPDIGVLGRLVLHPRPFDRSHRQPGREFDRIERAGGVAHHRYVPLRQRTAGVLLYDVLADEIRLDLRRGRMESIRIDEFEDVLDGDVAVDLAGRIHH